VPPRISGRIRTPIFVMTMMTVVVVVMGGFTEQLRQLGIGAVILKKRNDKSGNVDPRLVSDAYRLLFVEKKAPSHLFLACGDKDYEQMLVDYEGAIAGGWLLR
jgi:hypothetical protein